MPYIFFPSEFCYRGEILYWLHSTWVLHIARMASCRQSWLICSSLIGQLYWIWWFVCFLHRKMKQAVINIISTFGTFFSVVAFLFVWIDFMYFTHELHAAIERNTLYLIVSAYLTLPFVSTCHVNRHDRERERELVGANEWKQKTSCTETTTKDERRTHWFIWDLAVNLINGVYSILLERVFFHWFGPTFVHVVFFLYRWSTQCIMCVIRLISRSLSSPVSPFPSETMMICDCYICMRLIYFSPGLSRISIFISISSCMKRSLNKFLY